jgi:two-component system sensor histidine kinase YesM
LSYEHASYSLSGPNGLSLASSLFPQNGKKYETKDTILDGQFTSMISIPEKQLTRTIDRPLLRYMLLFLAVLLSIVLVSYLFASRITLFSNDFSKHLRKVGEGDFSVTFPPYGDEDIDRIGRTFNIMTGEINNLVEGVYKKQLLIQQMEIRQLQSQMNPHFLFNVLFSISVKAKEDGDETLYQMVHSLTVLLKGSLSTKEENEVTIAEEKEYVEAYLRIQEIRFGERLSHSFSIPEGILGYLCPRLSLEPLVENAVIHGIEPLSRPGHVTVSGTVSGDALRLSVIDDGEGFDPSRPAGIGEGKSNHIALTNLRERIRLLYGPAYGLEIDSAPSKGCRATIILPIRQRRIS